jgi:hypothetical protein
MDLKTAKTMLRVAKQQVVDGQIPTALQERDLKEAICACLAHITDMDHLLHIARAVQRKP